MLEKDEKSRVLHSFLDVEREGKHFKRISALGAVVFAHVVEECVFVTQVVISLHLAVAPPLVGYIFSWLTSYR